MIWVDGLISICHHGSRLELPGAKENTGWYRATWQWEKEWIDGSSTAEKRATYSTSIGDIARKKHTQAVVEQQQMTPFDASTTRTDMYHVYRNLATPSSMDSRDSSAASVAVRWIPTPINTRLTDSLDDAYNILLLMRAVSGDLSNTQSE